MNSDAIHAHLIEIGNTPSKNEKVALVAKYAADEDWKRTLAAALDPLVSYGIKKHPGTIGEHCSSEFDAGTWELIDDLAQRRLTGNAAIEALRGELTALTESSANLLWRIVTKKLAAGFDASTVNKAIKGLIRVYPYMRCSLPKDVKLDEFGWEEGAISQEKADGMFMNLDHEQGGLVRLTSRQGTEYPMDAFEAFADSVRATFAPGTQMHGEMLVTRNGEILPRQEGNGILNHIESGGTWGEGEAPLFMVWDRIPLSAVVPKGKYKVGYKARLANLITELRANPSPHIKLIPTRIVRSMKEAWAHFRELLLKGKEGTVVKKPTAIWKDGTSQEQIKLKLRAPFEARVKGFNLGTGKNTGKYSSLRCASECGAVEFDVNCRGDAMIDDVTKNPDNWREAIVVIEGTEITEPSESNPKHSIFLPIYVERRTDKDVADDLQRIRDQFQAAMEAA